MSPTQPPTTHIHPLVRRLTKITHPQAHQSRTTSRAGTELDTGIDPEVLPGLIDYWDAARGLYAPFDQPLTCSCDVYRHEMPGGQYTNLKFQVCPPPHLLLSFADLKICSRQYTNLKFQVGTITPLPSPPLPSCFCCFADLLICCRQYTNLKSQVRETCLPACLPAPPPTHSILSLLSFPVLAGWVWVCGGCGENLLALRAGSPGGRAPLQMTGGCRASHRFPTDDTLTNVSPLHKHTPCRHCRWGWAASGSA